MNAVLVNDWPLGFAEGIVHLVVWSKIPIAVDDERGDVISASRRLIEDFVTTYFGEPLGPEGTEQVAFFKNLVSLQSVRGVDHVHVIVKDAPDELLRQWTTRRDL